ncbi:AAA family ATPase [Methanocella sp. MCL-LM]|uniref:AAA family ATPase n=1 Tax=Methanocella sp. MCL-LM TaxID=3412035 RepID=UPI003C729A32
MIGKLSQEQAGALKSILDTKDSGIGSFNIVLKLKAEEQHKPAVEALRFENTNTLISAIKNGGDVTDTVLSTLGELEDFVKDCLKTMASDPKNLSGEYAGIFEGTRDLQKWIQRVRFVAVDTWKKYTLADALADRPEIEYAAKGIISLSSLSVVYGHPSSYKSFLMQDLAVSIAEGEHWLPPEQPTFNGRPADMSDIEPIETTQYPVLWVDQDQGTRRTLDRFAMLARGHDVTPWDAKLYFYSMPDPGLDATSREHMDALEYRIRDCGAKVVFIDCLLTVSGGVDENSTEIGGVLYSFRRLAESTGTAVVLIHHARKTTSNDTRAGDSLRGSSAIEGALDLALKIHRESPDAKTVTIASTKTRDVDVIPMTAKFVAFNDHNGKPAARFYRVDPEAAQQATDRSLELAIYEVLRLNPDIVQKRLVELARARARDNKRNEKYVIALLDELASKGKISVSRGKNNSKIYRLVD